MATMSYIPVYPIDPYMQGMHYKMKTEVLAEGQSRVVHIRSLPDDVSDKELIQLALPFQDYGKVVNMMMLKHKNQALLELENIETARAMVHHYTLNPCNIRQRIVYLQFSNHKELKTEKSPAQEKVFQNINRLQQEEGGKNHVLRVVIENPQYEVGLQVFKFIFSKFGDVLKIITFTKNNQFQALIQMADSIATETAKLSLDGQNIYTNCCTLRIDYSKLSTLNVKYNNEKSMDYTRQLTSGPPEHNEQYQGLTQGQMAQSQMLHSVQTQMQHGQLSHPIAHPHMAHQLNLQQLNVQQLNSLQTYHTGQTVPQNNCVLLVSNLDPDRITCYDLFILFGVYGDVTRVKILYNKKDNALLQMSDNTQAQRAMGYLNNKVLHDRPLRIVLSKHQQVQLPKDGQEAANLTKDFTNHSLHRYKKPNSKNFQNINPPNETLHLSNIPGEILEENLRQKFSKYGTVVNFRFFQKDRKMAILSMSSVEEAIRALVGLHNDKLSETNHLRVSFSKMNMDRDSSQAASRWRFII